MEVKINQENYRNMKQCPICQKRANKAQTWKKKRGKYNPTKERMQNPNLQWVQIPKDVELKPYQEFAGQRIKACTSCIKRLSKTK